MFLVLFLLAGCGGGTPTATQVSVVLPTVSTAMRVNDRGYEIQLQKAYLTVVDVQLEACPRPAWRQPTWLSPISSAYAHSTGAATKLKDPTVIDLLAPTASPLLQFSPAANAYCAWSVHLGAADADAVNVDTTGMLGKVIHLEGTRKGPHDASPVAFQIDSSAGLESEVSFQDETGAPARMVLDGKKPKATLRLSLSPTWLDGVDFAIADGAARAEKVMANVQAGLRAQVTTP